MRLFDLCMGCDNAQEVISLDPVTVPGKCCWQEVVCVRLKRNWPECKVGENVFSTESACAGFVTGSPRKVSPPLMIVASLRQI